MTPPMKLNCEYEIKWGDHHKTTKSYSNMIKVGKEQWKPPLNKSQGWEDSQMYKKFWKKNRRPIHLLKHQCCQT